MGAIAKHAPAGFCLRLGVLQGGTLVEERLVRGPDEVTVGPSPRCTIVLPDIGLPYRARTIFSRTPAGYALHLDERMEGRVDPGDPEDAGAIADLAARARRRGEAPRLLLDTRARGRLVFGDWVLLFQVVAAPPAAPRAQLPPSLRRPLAGRLDWFLVWITGVSLFAHGSLVMYLRGLDRPHAPDIADIPPRLAAIFDRFPSPWRPAARSRADAGPDVRPGTPSSPTRPVRPSRPSPPPATDREAMLVDVRYAVNKLLTSTGPDGRPGFVADLLRRGDVSGDADEVFRTLARTTVADLAPALHPRDGGAPTGELKRHQLNVNGPRAVETAPERGERQVPDRPIVRDGRPVEIDTDSPSCDPELVARGVRRHLGSLVSCYEHVLRREHGLAGKLQVRFTVNRSGKVTRAEIEQDTVGSVELSACVVASTRSWYFGGLSCGELQFSYPVIFQRSPD